MQVKGGMQKSECVLHLTLITGICRTEFRAGSTSIRHAIHIECRQYMQNTCQQKCSACSREDALDRGLGGKKCNMRLNRHMYSDLPICLIGMILYTETKIPFMYSFSGNFHIHVSVSDLYIFPGSFHIFSCSN